MIPPFISEKTKVQRNYGTSPRPCHLSVAKDECVPTLADVSLHQHLSVVRMSREHALENPDRLGAGLYPPTPHPSPFCTEKPRGYLWNMSFWAQPHPRRERPAGGEGQAMMNLNLVFKPPATQRDTGLLPHFNTMLQVQVFEVNPLERRFRQNTDLKSCCSQLCTLWQATSIL